MYTLNTKLINIKGIGEKLNSKFKAKNINNILDLLLFLPLRYVDRSRIGQVEDLNPDTEITFKAKVLSKSNFYRNKKSIQTAQVADETGKIKLIWFNNKFILSKLKKDQEFLFSGKLGKFKSVTQPTVESLTLDSIHTGRLVPIYSSSLNIKIGLLRRILKEVLDGLVGTGQCPVLTGGKLLPLEESLTQIHYPDNQNKLILARERLAIEELLGLIKKSQEIKKNWNKQKNDFVIHVRTGRDLSLQRLPFKLTTAQERATQKILQDLNKNTPMNRLLIGDVGCGKTVVAALAAQAVLESGFNVALVAPTKILAKQHADGLAKLFPDLQICLVRTGRDLSLHNRPALYIGTHKIINNLDKINPGLIIYDEQHKFGVAHRSESQLLKSQPHILTMSATPIPRSMMLSIFDHLDLSIIDEMPLGRKPIQTLLVSEKQRQKIYGRVEAYCHTPSKPQIIWVCPFIKKSKTPGFEQISSVEEKYLELKNFYQHKLDIACLHGKQNKKNQDNIIKNLYDQKINLLVTTPVVEVGIDLPQASMILIENAERFGLASLHQLRGRVGRAGQEAFCLVFSQNKQSRQRLKIFTQTNNGFKLAEYDLKNRGAGNIFGLDQHGFDNLKFSSWTNLELISQARKIFTQNPDYQPIINLPDNSDLPLAN